MGIFSQHALRPLVPIKCLNCSLPSCWHTTTFHNLWLCWRYNMSIKTLHHVTNKKKKTADYFMKRGNVFSVLLWHPRLLCLNLIEHLWAVLLREIWILKVRLTNQKELRDTIMSPTRKSPRVLRVCSLSTTFEVMFWECRRIYDKNYISAAKFENAPILC